MIVGSDLSFFSLIWGASLPVQMVMLILIGASGISWKYIYLKIKILKITEQSTDEFEKFFWTGGSLSSLFETLNSGQRDSIGLSSIFRAGYKEYLTQKQGSFDKKVSKVLEEQCEQHSTERLIHWIGTYHF